MGGSKLSIHDRSRLTTAHDCSRLLPIHDCSRFTTTHCNNSRLLTFTHNHYDYDPIYERVQLEYYEKSLVKHVFFGFQKFNRTYAVLNLSFELTDDLDGRNIFGTSKMYVFVSNTYKYTGIHIDYNVCEQWKNNLFMVRTYLGKFGNLEACDIKKGHYYLHNFVPDRMQLPQKAPFNIPVKFEIDVFRRNGQRILLFAWYGTPNIRGQQPNDLTQTPGVASDRIQESY
ncbi:unnamed protein product [Brassicogethes aeneus]|uniref:Uncharacterized protein n=1 Tax=Brassicogethes aeneus TaxID=1431903 RepID=A0A9P0AXS5_BRAAE|nr:unnamed protein product [Brassicogethes aeneus]